jgi:hypothetical protein
MCRAPRRCSDEHTRQSFLPHGADAQLPGVHRKRTHRLDRLAGLRCHHKLVLSILIVFGILALVVYRPMRQGAGPLGARGMMRCEEALPAWIDAPAVSMYSSVPPIKGRVQGRPPISNVPIARTVQSARQ